MTIEGMTTNDVIAAARGVATGVVPGGAQPGVDTGPLGHEPGARSGEQLQVAYLLAEPDSSQLAPRGQPVPDYAR